MHTQFSVNKFMFIHIGIFRKYFNISTRNLYISMQRNLRHNNWRTKCPFPCPYVHVHVYVTCMSLSLSMSTDMDNDMTWTWHIICTCIYDFQHCYHSSLFTIQHYVLFGVYYFKPFWPFRHYSIYLLMFCPIRH